MGYNFYNIREGMYNHRSIVGRLLVVAVALMLAVPIGLSMRANAATGAIVYDEVPLTQTELDNNWGVDRMTPSGDYGSETYEGRDDTLRMGIDTSNRTNQSSFYYTEGLQRQTDGAVSVRADLFVEESWEDTDVRAGLWPVGYDSSNSVSAYPILEYTTMGTDDYSGWRVWDNVDGGWTNLEDVAANLNDWNTLEVKLDADTSQFDFYVNGTKVASNNADVTTNIDAVILNNYNAGPTTASYDVHWSNFALGMFVADTTAPDVSITSPTDGALVTGSAEFRGTIVEDNLLRYYYVLRDASGTKVLDKTVTTDDVLTDDVFLTFDTTTLTEGETYTLQLEARDDALNKDAGSVDKISFVVNNVPDDKEQCKNDGWALFGAFKNQGQCVASVVASPNSAVSARN